MQELAEFLTSNGFRVTVITGSNGNKKLPLKEEINGVSIIRVINKKDGVRLIAKINSYLSFYWNLKRVLRKELTEGSILMVLSTPPLIGLVPLKFKKKKRIKLIYNIQDLYPDILIALKKAKPNSLIYRLLERLSKKIIEDADHIVPICSTMKSILENKYERLDGKLTLIENWHLKTLHRQSVSRELADKLKILYTGNMGRAHEYNTLLEAVKILRDEPVKFVISGGGYNYERLKKEAYGLPNIKFQSFVEKEQLSKLINSADICLVIGRKSLSGIVLPSKFYGYVACGKPVIYINSGTDSITNHILKGNFGYIIENGDSKTFAKIIKDLLSNKSELDKITRNAVHYYETNLKREYSLNKYLELFKRMDGENG